jgi:hypothetical protein
MVGAIYLIVCPMLGFFIPSILPKPWKRHPALWLLGQGVLAWMIAALVLAVLNLTPLCVGQDNGDGNNDLALCMVQTSLVCIVYSPLGFILLCLNSLPGGWLIKRFMEGTVP